MMLNIRCIVIRTKGVNQSHQELVNSKGYNFHYF